MTARMRTGHISVAVLLALAVAGAALLLLFPPTQNGFYPHCPVYALTGLLCPGCGGTRAVAALLRGHVGEALGWNALVTVAALLLGPAFVVYGAAARVWPEQGFRARLERWQRPMARVGLVAAFVFTLWRNLR